MQSPAYIHPNLKLLSNSSCVTLHKCPRKFQLYRLKTPDKSAQDSNVDFLFGTWVGTGIQTYMATASVEKAYFSMFLINKEYLFEEYGVKKKKTFLHALRAIDAFVELWDTEFKDYELVWLEGKPSIELGFILDCVDNFTYRGFLDALLIHKYSRELAVLECKTTGFSNVHEAVYKNSAQGLGYSLVTDTIAEQLTAAGVKTTSSWKVFYPVWKTPGEEWEVFEFAKSNSQRVSWIKNILRDIKHITDYAEDDHFPMQGESCFDFFRPCEYFEVCEMSNEYLIGDLAKVTVKLENDDKYQFKFSLIDLITTQRARLA